MTGPPAVPFVDRHDHLNLEIAAGCGDFGQQFFPLCILTDKDQDIHIRCENHSIDLVCDACELPWGSNRFDNVIMCNPYNFGFSDTDESLPLLREITRVLKPDGKIIVLGSKKNKYVMKLPVTLEKVRDQIDATLDCVEQSFEHQTDYPSFVFRSTEGQPTTPNIRYVIHVTK